MRILLCHNHYQQPGGEDRSFADEAWLLESRGHDVVRFTHHNDRICEMNPPDLALKTFWNRAVYDEIRYLIQRERPDVMHCTNLFPLISPAAYYAARRGGVPIVQSLRNYRLLCANATFFRDGGPCEDCLGKRFAWPGVVHGCYRGDRVPSTVTAGMIGIHRMLGTWRRAVDIYFTPSEFAREKFIVGGIPAERVMVKPNFVRPDPGPGAGRGGYAVFVGRLSAEKGLETLLEAWAGSRTQRELVIVGDGPQADRVRTAADRDRRIRWLGRMENSDAIDVVKNAALLIMPSLVYETFGRTIVEAYACGTPVLASRLGAVQELVEEGRTGMLFRPGDPGDLADKVDRLAEDPKRLGEMRVRARERFEAHFTPEKNYGILMEIYARATDRGRARTGRPVEGTVLSTVGVR